MCRRFFEKNGLRFDQFPSAHATTYNVGISVRTSIKTKCSNHSVMLSFLCDVVDVQYGRRLGPHLLTKGRILGERLTVRRNQFLQFGAPSATFQFFCEAALNDLNHDPHSSGRTRRSTQHRNDGMIGCADKLRAKFQDAAVSGILFDDLHPLARYFDSPILLLCIWKELAERGEALLRRLEYLAYQIFLESHVIHADRQQRKQIFRIDGVEEV